MNTLGAIKSVKTIRTIERIEKAKKEVVVIQTFEEINVNNSKTLVPLDTQTFIIKCLDGEQNSSSAATAAESQGIQQQKAPINKQEDEISSSQWQSSDCVICKQTFTNSYDKRIHELKHFGLRPHRCVLCMEHFVLSSEYYLHRCKESPRRAPKPHPVRDAKEKYPNQPNVFCHLCKKCFCGLNKLKRHETVHSKERPYKCEKCHRSFSQWFGRKNHVCQTRKRSFTKNVDCKTCGKVFQNEITSIIHYLGHYITGNNNLFVLTDNLLNECWSKIKNDSQAGTNDFRCFDNNSDDEDDDDDEDSECFGLDDRNIPSYLYNKLHDDITTANEPLVEIAVCEDNDIHLDYDDFTEQ